MIFDCLLSAYYLPFHGQLLNSVPPSADSLPALQSDSDCFSHFPVHRSDCICKVFLVFFAVSRHGRSQFSSHVSTNKTDNDIVIRKMYVQRTEEPVTDSSRSEKLYSRSSAAALASTERRRKHQLASCCTAHTKWSTVGATCRPIAGYIVW